MSHIDNSAAIELTAKVLRKAGKEVLHDIDLTIKVGEIVALVGPNGGGKSTLLSTLAGDNSDVDFEVKFFGSNAREITIGELARTRSVIEQRASALVGYPVQEMVTWGGFSTSKSSTELAEFVAANLEYFELSEIRNSQIDSISGGQWARVLLARVATQAAPIFLGDEPDAALDSHSTQLMYQWLRESKKTAVIATHDVLTAQKFADRILRVENGQVVEETA